VVIVEEKDFDHYFCVMEKREWPLFVYGGLSSCIAEFSKLLYIHIHDILIYCIFFIEII